jgi:hypothetical protein
MKQTPFAIAREPPTRKPAHTHAKFRLNAVKLFKSRGAGQEQKLTEQKLKGKTAAVAMSARIQTVNMLAAGL